nr:hypothetical protein [Tanacetum cinerariifolium]
MIEKRSGERGGKWGEKRLTGMAGNTVHSTVFQNVKDREDDNMANENVPSPDPIRSNDQILPFSAWLDKDWFTLDVNLLREALEITPIDQAHQFESPPLGNEIMDFMNELGSPKGLYFVLRMVVNNLYQPWRAILSMINQCLTGKTSVYDRPRYPAIHNFVTDKANLGIATKKDKKIKHHVIPYFAKHDHKITAEEGGKKKSAAKADQSKKPTTAKKPKPVSSKQSKPAPAKQQKPMKEKSTPVKKAGKVTEEASIGPSAQPEDATSANIVRNTPSPIEGESLEIRDYQLWYIPSKVVLNSVAIHFEVRPVGLRWLNRAIWKDFGNSERSTPEGFKLARENFQS